MNPSDVALRQGHRLAQLGMILHSDLKNRCRFATVFSGEGASPPDPKRYDCLVATASEDISFRLPRGA